MSTQERINRSTENRGPGLQTEGEVRDALSGVTRVESSPEVTVDGARTAIDAAFEAVEQPMTDATAADRAPRPGHAEVAGGLGQRLFVLREALLNAVNGE